MSDVESYAVWAVGLVTGSILGWHGRYVWHLWRVRRRLVVKYRRWKANLRERVS